MNLLMIDDDILILQDLKKKIDWKGLGFDSVFTAGSAEAALQLIEQVPVHIMMCDIEMPGMNGLDLLSCLRKQHPDIPFIVLTSYARFEYAQRAISLNIVDYLLKPVSGLALIDSVSRAIGMVKQKSEEKDSQLYGQYWINEKRNIQESFWQRAASGSLSVLGSTAWKLSYLDTDLFIPVLIEVSRRSVLSEWDYATLEYTIKNVSYEIFDTKELTPHCVIPVKENRWLAVVSADKGADADTSLLEEQTESMLHFMEKQMSIPLCFGIGNAVPYGEIQDAVLKLTGLLDRTIDRSGHILHAGDQPSIRLVSAAPELQLWESLLLNGDEKSLLNQMELFLTNHSSELTLEDMIAFRQDVVQIVYSYLKQHQIQSRRLFADALSEELYRNAHQSITDMMSYCRLLVKRSLEYALFSEEPQNVIDKVRAYLDTHFTDDIQRNDLAGIVYISPDYLSRLFKKETGASLTKYINDKRIEAACRLLKESSLAIHGVAMQVGFSSFAYFSKVFRESTGMTPVEYRKSKQ